MILVDYRCPSCGVRVERGVASPPPAELPCPACGGPARRVFSAPNLLGRASGPVSLTPKRPEQPLCRRNPWVPGLCHVEPSAARAYVARARGDNRTLEREIERQERAFREAPEALRDPLGSHHGHGHSSGHTQGDGHSHDESAAVATPAHSRSPSHGIEPSAIPTEGKA